MIRLKSLVKAAKKIGRSNIRAFSICIAIASVLWLFQSMGREYTADITLPVTYSNLPKNKTFSTTPINSLQLKVTGFGWDLWAYKLKFNKPNYTIDVEKLGSQNNISLSNAKDLIIESIPGLTNILSLQPESITLAFDEALRKKVPVVSALEIKPASGFGFTSASPVPDSVEIFGSKNVISKIEKISTRQDEITNAQGEIEKLVALDFPDGVSEKSVENVTVKALIEPLTEKELELRIKVEGYKGNKKVNIYPKVVTLKVQTTISLFDKIENSDLEVYVDFNDLTEDNGDLLPVKVRKNNQFIESYRVHPRYVDYFLEE